MSPKTPKRGFFAFKNKEDSEQDPLIAKDNAEPVELKTIKKKTEPKELLWGLKVKKETTIWNFAAVIMLPLIGETGFNYINAQLPFLLQDPDYFDIDFAGTGKATGEILFWSLLVSTCAIPFLGELYDLIGRRWVLLPTCALFAGVLAIVPYSAPHFWMLVALRTVLMIGYDTIDCSPLIVDYVKSESRGFASAWSAIGYSLGNFIFIFLFSATRGMGMIAQFTLPAAIIFAMSVPLFFFMREPEIKLPLLDVTKSTEEDTCPQGTSLHEEAPDRWQ